MIRLRELREALKLQHKDIAASIGIERSTYTKYETGGRSPNNDMLSRLADYFNVTTDYLLERTDEPNPQPTPKNPAIVDGVELDGDERDLVRNYRLLKPEDRPEAASFVLFKLEQYKKRDQLPRKGIVG